MELKSNNRPNYLLSRADLPCPVCQRCSSIDSIPAKNPAAAVFFPRLRLSFNNDVVPVNLPSQVAVPYRASGRRAPIDALKQVLHG